MIVLLRLGYKVTAITLTWNVITSKLRDLPSTEEKKQTNKKVKI